MPRLQGNLRFLLDHQLITIICLISLAILLSVTVFELSTKYKIFHDLTIPDSKHPWRMKLFNQSGYLFELTNSTEANQYLWLHPTDTRKRYYVYFWKRQRDSLPKLYPVHYGPMATSNSTKCKSTVIPLLDHTKRFKVCAKENLHAERRKRSTKIRTRVTIINGTLTDVVQQNATWEIINGTRTRVINVDWKKYPLPTPSTSTEVYFHAPLKQNPLPEKFKLFLINPKGTFKDFQLARQQAEDVDYQALQDAPSTLTSTKEPEGLTNAISELSLPSSYQNYLKSQIDKYFMIGYDCRSPTSVTPISSYIPDYCKPQISDHDQVIAEKKSVFQILQYEKQREIQGYRCTKTLSRDTFFCGNHDHSTPYPQLSFASKSVTLTTDECKRLKNTQKYTAGDGKEYTIPQNTVYRISYFRQGHTRPHSGNLGTEITCEGSALNIDGTLIYHMVVYDTETIYWDKEKIIKREDDSIVAFLDNIRLPCLLEDKQCVTSQGTYVWPLSNKNHCPLYYVKSFTGQITSMSTRREKVIMSTDGSLVRFILGPTKSECDLKAYTTNYPELMIIDTIASDGTIKTNLIKRKLPARETKLSAYITNRDDVLYSKTKELIRKEFSIVLQESCKQNLEKTKTRHFLERELPAFRPYRLGGANYLTTAGEVTYFYKCKPVLTMALETGKCYDALPVRIMRKHDQVSINPSLEEGEPKHFLEPLSHRLSSMARETPCVERFFSRYKDIFDRWYAITPQFVSSESPDILDFEKISYKNLMEDDDTDFSQGGIYTSEQVDSLQNFLEFQRLQDVVTHKLATQAGKVAPGQYITPNMLFPPYSLPGGSWHSFILGKIWGALRGLGEFTSSMIALFVILRLLWYIFKVLANCRYLYSVHGFSSKLAWSFCTEVFFTKHYQKACNNDYDEKPHKTGHSTNSFTKRVQQICCPTNSEPKNSEGDYGPNESQSSVAQRDRDFTAHRVLTSSSCSPKSVRDNLPSYPDCTKPAETHRHPTSARMHDDVVTSIKQLETQLQKRL